MEAAGTILVTGATGYTPSSVEITILDNDRFVLSIETSWPTSACGAPVTDFSVRLETGLRLTPAPDAETETQVRIIGASSSPLESWRGAFWIGASRTPGRSGHSAFVRHITFAELRTNFPGFRGFEYRLKDIPAITAQCTWRFEGDNDEATQQSVQQVQQPQVQQQVVQQQSSPRLAVLAQAATSPYAERVAQRPSVESREAAHRPLGPCAPGLRRDGARLDADGGRSAGVRRQGLDALEAAA